MYMNLQIPSEKQESMLPVHNIISKTQPEEVCWKPFATSTPLKPLLADRVKSQNVDFTKQKRLIPAVETVNIIRNGYYKSPDKLENMKVNKQKLTSAKKSHKKSAYLFDTNSSSDDEDCIEKEKKPGIKINSEKTEKGKSGLNNFSDYNDFKKQKNFNHFSNKYIKHEESVKSLQNINGKKVNTTGKKTCKIVLDKENLTETNKNDKFKENHKLSSSFKNINDSQISSSKNVNNVNNDLLLSEQKFELSQEPKDVVIVEKVSNTGNTSLNLPQPNQEVKNNLNIVLKKNKKIKRPIFTNKETKSCKRKVSKDSVVGSPEKRIKKKRFNNLNISKQDTQTLQNEEVLILSPVSSKSKNSSPQTVFESHGIKQIIPLGFPNTDNNPTESKMNSLNNVNQFQKKIKNSVKKASSSKAVLINETREKSTRQRRPPQKFWLVNGQTICPEEIQVLGTSEKKIKRKKSKNMSKIGTNIPQHKVVATLSAINKSRNSSHQLFSDSKEEELINSLDLTKIENDEKAGDPEKSNFGNLIYRKIQLGKTLKKTSNSKIPVYLKKGKCTRQKKLLQSSPKEVPENNTEDNCENVSKITARDKCNTVQCQKNLTCTEKPIENAIKKSEQENKDVSPNEDLIKKDSTCINSEFNETNMKDLMTEGVNENKNKSSANRENCNFVTSEDEGKQIEQKTGLIPDNVVIPEVIKHLDDINKPSDVRYLTAECWSIQNFKCGVIRVCSQSQIISKTKSSNSYFGGTLVKGILKMNIGSKKLKLKQGDMAFIPPLTDWSMINTSENESVFYYWHGRF